MIVLDASVLIAYLDADDEHHDRAERLLSREIDDELVGNPLTLAEVLVGPTRDGTGERARAILRALDVQEQPFPADTAVALARLRVATSAKMPDCCVLLTAEEVGGKIASFDKRLVQAAEQRGLDTIDR